MHAALAGLAFAAYTAWCFLPLTLLETRIERELGRALEHVGESAEVPDIGLRIAGRTFLGPDQFTVEKEAPYGKRIIRVHATAPQEIEFLGATRVFEVDVDYVHDTEVNEEALARSLERYRAKQADAAQAHESDARRAQNLEQALDECQRRYGHGKCRIWEGVGGPSVQPVL